MSRGVEEILLPLHSSKSDSTPWYHKLRGRPLFRWLSLFFLTSIAIWLLGPWIVGDIDREKLSFPALDDLWGSHDSGDHEVMINGSVWNRRREEVKEAYLHAYKGYMDHAFPADELLPLTNRSINNFNGWAVTLLDSIDTMWLMGLEDEFQNAVGVVANQTLATRPAHAAPFFETIIRYLGGLLSAYALSKEPIFLTRADDLGRKLLPAFDAYESGLPSYSVDTNTGKAMSGWTGGSVLWAEAMSCQVEYKYLAKLTGRAEYYEKVERIMELMYNVELTDKGLFPDKFSGNGLPQGGHITIGAAADSGYEYFLKQWILTGDVKARQQYITSANAIINNLMFVTPERNLLYVTDLFNGHFSHHHEHLSCFFPGVLALGVYNLGSKYLTPKELELHAWAAKGLANTCWTIYGDMETGLSPDGVRFSEEAKKWVDVVQEWIDEGRPVVAEPEPMDLVEDGHHHRQNEQRDSNHGHAGRIWQRAANQTGPAEPPGVRRGPLAVGRQKEYIISEDVYMLRPETVESMYIMWKVTKDPVWREMGYSIFNSIQRWTRTPSGFASVSRVNHLPPTQKDDMPSFFLAETLKYLYLLFSEQDPISLDQWVFNTEAHPLPVFEWSEWERTKYNIVGEEYVAQLKDKSSHSHEHANGAEQLGDLEDLDD